MVYCNVFCLEMPDDLPVTELIQFMSAARSVLLEPMNVSVWKEFAGSTNVIGWRYRATLENWQIYKNSWATTGSNAGSEDVYKPELALFSMFGAGVSCIESTAYALATLASHPALLSLQFTEIEHKKCSPEKLADWLSNHPTAVGLTSNMVTFRLQIFETKRGLQAFNLQPLEFFGSGERI